LFFGEHLAVVPGLRWEVLRDDFPGNVASRTAPGTGAAVSTNDYLSPRLGVRGEVGYGLTLLGNASRSVRPPNLFELFGNRGVIQGNPNLSAETSLAWDIGFRLAVPGQGTWLQAASLEYAYFDAQVDDLIQLVVTSPGVSVPQNIGSATLRGHELNARVRLWDRLGLIGNYTHQDTRDDGGKDNTYLGKELARRPADAAYGRLELEWSPEHPLPLGRLFARAWPGQVFFETNFIGDNFLTRANLDRFHVDSRVLYGAGLRLSLPWPRWQVGIEGRNLTNDLTSDVAGFPVPGRSWFASVSYGFAR